MPTTSSAEGKPDLTAPPATESGFPPSLATLTSQLNAERRSRSAWKARFIGLSLYILVERILWPAFVLLLFNLGYGDSIPPILLPGSVNRSAWSTTTSTAGHCCPKNCFDNVSEKLAEQILNQLEVIRSRRSG